MLRTPFDITQKLAQVNELCCKHTDSKIVFDLQTIDGYRDILYTFKYKGEVLFKAFDYNVIYDNLHMMVLGANLYSINFNK